MEEFEEMMAGGAIIFMILLGIVVYIWLSICLQKVAQKTNTPNGWLAWIPVANIYLMCMIAGKPWWWLLLCLIPYVDIVFLIILSWKISEARGKPGWWALLLLVPIANLVIPGIWAFSD